MIDLSDLIFCVAFFVVASTADPCHVIFATSSTHIGDFGGIAGANVICTSLASSGMSTAAVGDLSDNGGFVAYLGSNGVLPSDLVKISLTNCTMLSSTMTLHRGALETNSLPVSENELGEPVSGDVWTGVDRNGGPGDTCSNWMSTENVGSVGDLQRGSGWLADSSLTCAKPARIYCLSVNALDCVAQDCEMSAWSTWSACVACSQPVGHRTRTRNVATPARCGSACTSSPVDVESCLCPCTDWSPWSSCDCSANTPNGSRERTRTGPACPTSQELGTCSCCQWTSSGPCMCDVGDEFGIRLRYTNGPCAPVVTQCRCPTAPPTPATMPSSSSPTISTDSTQSSTLLTGLTTQPMETTSGSETGGENTTANGETSGETSGNGETSGETSGNGKTSVHGETTLIGETTLTVQTITSFTGETTTVEPTSTFSTNPSTTNDTDLQVFACKQFLTCEQCRNEAVGQCSWCLSDECIDIGTSCSSGTELPQSEGCPSNDMWLLIGGVAGGCCLIVAVLLIVLLIRGKGKQQAHHNSVGGSHGSATMYATTDVEMQTTDSDQMPRSGPYDVLPKNPGYDKIILRNGHDEYDVGGFNSYRK